MHAVTEKQSAAGTSPTPAPYRSAYRGYVTDDNGRFTHLQCAPDESHLQNGYWSFSTADDEHRAFRLGFHSPEDILISIDHGERDMFSDITLLWLPGRLDSVLKAQIVGTAAQHLVAIYGMRKFLGRALSFRGHVPTYPLDARLGDYWKSQRIPATLLPAIDSMSNNNKPLPCSPDQDAHAAIYSISHGISISVDDTALAPSNDADTLPQQAPLPALDMSFSQHAVSPKTRLQVGSADAIYPPLPCMDCGEEYDSGHKPGCHLDITPVESLTVLDYRNLADSVQRFDPGPWTTHQGPPPAASEPEDAAMQIQEMAAIIRNEDTYKAKPELHSLPDEFMIVAWALQMNTPDIEIICE
ncbi:hypothetical protein ACEQ8H_000456 [Pleosporales sp. CAS-2024a]